MEMAIEIVDLAIKYCDVPVRYVSSQWRPQATGNETVFFVAFLFWVVGDANVIVNLLTPCMLRDTQGLGWGECYVIVNSGAAWFRHIHLTWYLFTYISI